MDVEDHPSRNMPNAVEMERLDRNRETREKYPWNAPPEKTKPAMPEFGRNRD